MGLSHLGLAFGFARPVANVGLEHLVLKVLAIDHGLGHVVKADHALQFPVANDRHVTRMALQHHAAHFVQLGVWRAGERMVVHGAAHRRFAQRSPVFAQGLNDFAKRQHAHQITVLHHHQRAQIFFGHVLHGQSQRLHGVNGEQSADAFDTQDIGDFHGFSPEK